MIHDTGGIPVVYFLELSRPPAAGSAWTKFTTPHVRSPRKRRASCTSCRGIAGNAIKWGKMDDDWGKPCFGKPPMFCSYKDPDFSGKSHAKARPREKPLNLNDSNRAFHTIPYVLLLEYAFQTNIQIVSKQRQGTTIKKYVLLNLPYILRNNGFYHVLCVQTSKDAVATTQSQKKTIVLWHDGDALGMNGTKVGILRRLERLYHPRYLVVVSVLCYHILCYNATNTLVVFLFYQMGILGICRNMDAPQRLI